MLWLMLLRGHGAWRFVQAEAPCCKGECEIPMFGWHLVIGWAALDGPGANDVPRP
jgi:hypothetical protein